MTEAEWLSSKDPMAMLRVAAGRISNCCGCKWADNLDGTISMLPGENCCPRCDNAPFLDGFKAFTSDRKLRLFSCACANLARLARTEAYDFVGRDGERWPGNQPEIEGISDAVFFARIWCRSQTDREFLTPAMKCDLLRSIIGNPYRPILLPKKQPACTRCGSGSWRVITSEMMWCRDCDMRWQWPADAYQCPLLSQRVRALAEEAYNQMLGEKCNRCNGRGWFDGGEEDEGIAGLVVECPALVVECPACRGFGRICHGCLDNDRLAILADAVEDAGCTEQSILDQLRGVGPHFRGLWSLDLLLGKE